MVEAMGVAIMIYTIKTHEKMLSLRSQNVIETEEFIVRALDKPDLWCLGCGRYFIDFDEPCEDCGRCSGCCICDDFDPETDRLDESEYCSGCGRFHACCACD
jgi:hypothetical protein